MGRKQGKGPRLNLVCQLKTWTEELRAQRSELGAELKAAGIAVTVEHHAEFGGYVNVYVPVGDWVRAVTVLRERTDIRGW